MYCNTAKNVLLALGTVSLMFLLGNKGYAATLSPGQTTRTVTVGTGSSQQQREYILYVPSNPINEVVLAFHGGGGNPTQFIGQTDLENFSELSKFIVAFPYGTPADPNDPNDVLTWNAGFCCGQALAQNVDEAAFVTAIESDISTLVAGVGKTAPSFYGTGFSNGALLVEMLAQQNPSLFSAIAPVAGTYKGVASNTFNQTSTAASPFLPNQPPLPPDPTITSVMRTDALLIHGVEDPNIPYYGGTQTASLSQNTVPLTVPPFDTGDFNFWQRVNGCENPISIGTISQQITVKTQTCNGKTVTAIVGESMGHVWPGDPNQLEGVVSPPYTNYCASQEILEFFENPNYLDPNQSLSCTQEITGTISSKIMKTSSSTSSSATYHHATLQMLKFFKQRNYFEGKSSLPDSEVFPVSQSIPEKSPVFALLSLLGILLFHRQ